MEHLYGRLSTPMSKTFKTFSEFYTYLQIRLENNENIDDQVYIVDRPIFEYFFGMKYNAIIREKEIDRILRMEKPSYLNLIVGTVRVIGHPKYRSKLWRVVNGV